MNLQTQWGARLRAARHEREMSIIKLSRLADVDPGGLSRIERGLQTPSDEVRLRIAAALEMDPNDLWSYPAKAAS